MARIIGPKGGHATLTGTSGNDFIFAYGGSNTITGGGGNDTIVARHGEHNSISVGSAGDMSTNTDIIHIDGAYDTVTGGDEAFAVMGYVHDSDVSLGRGNDTVSLDGSMNVITVIAGNDVIRAVGGHDTVNFAGGASNPYTDKVVVSGFGNTVSDTLTDGPYPDLGALNIYGGSGYGTFATGTTSGTIVTQGSHNFIEAGYDASTIVAGSGHDTVELSGGPRDIGGNSRVTFAGQHNLLTGTGEGATVSGGSGYDTYTLTGQSVGNQGTFQISDTGQRNSITIDAGTAAINAGSGNDTVAIVSGIASMVFHGSGDVLQLSGDQIYAGYPTSTVSDQSSGLNIFLEASDGSHYPSAGNLTIDHFDRTGVLNFVDGRGGFTSVSQVISDLKSDGHGDYSLVLPDGSGTITFLHPASLTGANFRV